MKYYLKLNKKVLKFNQIKVEIKKAFTKITKQHNKNYFYYAYDSDKLTLPNITKRKTTKNYKI